MTTTPNPTPTSQILDAAADLIEERGWGGTWGSPDDTAPVCLEGAICAAIGADFTTGEMWVCPAYAAVQSYLDLDPSRRLSVTGCPETGFELWRWNDTRDRTAEQVIEVLRAAALLEAAREEAATQAPRRPPRGCAVSGAEYEWRAGDVAMVRAGGRWVRAMRTDGPQRPLDAGWRTTTDAMVSADAEARRIVVIDPEDDRQISRLTTRLRGLPVGELALVPRRSNSGDTVVKALTSFNEPPMPEPAGDYAVVEDEERLRWLKVPDRRVWMCVSSGSKVGTTAEWRDLDAIRVLSDGVSS